MPEIQDKFNNNEESYRRRLTRQVSMHTLMGFNELRLNVKLCDASLILDSGDMFPVHRSVLSGSSDYFRVLFTTTLHEGDFTQINLKLVDSYAMESILQYIYLRQVDITCHNATDIMRTADYLGIEGLVQLCQEFFTDILSPDNCVTLLQFADYFYFTSLKNVVYRYIIREFMNIAEKSDQLLHLTYEEFGRIIEDSELNVKYEERVWDNIVKWVDKDPDKRKDDIVYLLSKVRFGLMDSQYFLENVKDNCYVKGRADCKPYIIETLKFLYDLQLTSNTTNSIAPMLARPRYPYEVMFAIGGWSGGSPTGFIETYDTKSDRWTRVYEEDPYGPRAYHGTIVIDKFIYVIGGFDGLDYFNSCRKFNTLTKSWEEVAPMNCRRCYVSVALLDGYIYAMGGYDGHHRQNSAEKFDLQRNQWSMIAPMAYQRSDACATIMNGKLYITGGFNGQECMNSAETYNPATNEWTLIPPMRSRRSGVSCIAYHGFLYVIGGFNGISRMNSGEKFNPRTNTWSPVVNMSNPRSNFAVEVLDDMIFVVGGFNGVTTIAHVECYNDRTDEWFEARNMHIFRSALSTCVLKNLDNIKDYLPPDRDRLSEEGRRSIERNSRQNNINVANDDTSNEVDVAEENNNVIVLDQAVQVVNSNIETYDDVNTNVID